MDQAKSFTEVDAQAVAAACKAFTAARVANINSQREALIDAEMSRRFFRPKSREEARKALEKNWADPLTEIHITGAYWDRRARELLALAEISTTGRVCITSDDAMVIARFMPRDSATVAQ